ncbi:MAG TPA: hypothetical protein VMU54_00355, partial [Planctomycetota bacterium]|nr:hypothetical protein [Planctomycetota bacterium]
MSELWSSYRGGLCSLPTSLLLGVVAALFIRVAALVVLRPLIHALSSKEIPKIFQSRLRRAGFAMSLASLALGIYIACHAYWPPDVRIHKFPYEFSELLLIVSAGYIVLEILLSFFGDWLPRMRSQTPMAPIIKDLVRAFALVGVALMGVKYAFPEVDIGALMTTSAILSVVVGLAL